MADPTVFEVTSMVGTAVALAISSWKALAKRNVDTLDKTLEHLAKSVDDLGKQLQDLRLTDNSQAGQIARMQADVENLEKRIDGQGKAHREELDRIAPRTLRKVRGE